jgi:uroporphyrinogen-III decarboxylase
VRGLGVHIFNFTHRQSLAKTRELTGPDVCLLGNVPPLEILAQGTADAVGQKAAECLQSLPGRQGLILSAGGGVSPGTPGANIRALVNATRPRNPPS